LERWFGLTSPTPPRTCRITCVNDNDGVEDEFESSWTEVQLRFCGAREGVVYATVYDFRGRAPEPLRTISPP
jgi:hypothetical protein